MFLSKPPLVAWSWVCLPKKNGGLGVHDCIAWNIAAVGKYVWQIAKKTCFGFNGFTMSMLKIVTGGNIKLPLMQVGCVKVYVEQKRCIKLVIMTKPVVKYLQ